MSHFFIDRGKGTFRLSPLLIVNVMVLLVLCALVIDGVILLYPWMPVGVGALFALDLLVAWRAPRLRLGSLGRPAHVPKLLWFAAVVFTAAGIVAAYKFVRNPDALSATQALVACALVGYIWFLVNRLSNRRIP